MRRFMVPRVAGALAGSLALSAGMPRPAIAQLARQTFPIDLGSGLIQKDAALPFDEPFWLSGTAPASLLQIRLWYEQNGTIDRVPAGQTASTYLGGLTGDPRHRLWCAHLRPPAPNAAQTVTERVVGDTIFRAPSTVWDRTGLDSVSQFLLEAGPIDPNTDYTFCFQLLRRPTADDSTKFARALASNLVTFFWQHAANPAGVVATPQAVHALLRGALPPADSIEIDDAASVLRPLPAAGAPPAAMQPRLNAIIVEYATLLQRAQNLATDIVIFQNERTKTVAALDALRGHQAELRALPRVAEGAARSASDLVAFRAATLALARLVDLTPAQVQAIAQGQVAIDGNVDVLNPFDLTRLRTNDAVAPLRENLTHTIAVLRDASTMLTLLRENLPLRTRAGLDDAKITALERTLSAARIGLEQQFSALRLVAEVLDAVARHAADLAGAVARIDFARILLRGTTSVTYEARANTYIGLDAGLLSARQLRTVVPYFGVNVYTRPVNKRAPLKTCRSHCFAKRASFFLGVTTNSIAQEQRIADLFDGHTVMAGAGYRFTDYWRLSLGALLFKSYRDVGGERVLRANAQPGGSASIDIDIVSLLGRAGSFLFPSPKGQ